MPRSFLSNIGLEKLFGSALSTYMSEQDFFSKLLKSTAREDWSECMSLTPQEEGNPKPHEKLVVLATVQSGSFLEPNQIPLLFPHSQQLQVKAAEWH